MKYFKNLILTVITLTIISPVFAGDTKLGGIRAGWHYADMYEGGSSATDGNPLSSFYFGFYKNNKLAPTINWTSGIEYFQNGFQVDADNKRILHTISIPMALKLKVGPVYGLGGFGLNFKVSEKFTVAGQDVTDTGGFEKAKVFDVPVFLGLGFSVLMFSLEARYHWGLLEADKTFDDKSIKNQYLQIGVGVEF